RGRASRSRSARATRARRRRQCAPPEFVLAADTVRRDAADAAGAPRNTAAHAREAISVCLVRQGQARGMRRAGVLRRAIAVSVVAVVALAGCTAEPMPSPSPSPEYVSTYEPPAPTQIAPLLGTTVEAGSLEHPAVSAKIDNHWDAR